MVDCQITPDKLLTISEELEVDLHLVEGILPNFKDFYEEVRKQHLASIMRALELHVRRKLKKTSFVINWSYSDKSVKATPAILRFDWGIVIMIPSGLNDVKQIRDIIAHELGHLFYLMEHPENSCNKDLNQKMANVFGILAMFQRNEFYTKKAKKMVRTVWMQIVKDFKNLGC
jgi:predicted SprT family Zn-dependent metalloprotease